MSFYQIVFSPSGGTQKVTALFTKSFCPENTRIDLTDRSRDFSLLSFTPEDLCVVSVPSYGGRVPAAAVSRLHQMKGNKARAVLLVVYGNRAYDDTLAELQDVLTDAGWICIAAVAAVAEHSIMRQFAAGRPDAQDQKELAAFAEQVRMKLESGADTGSLSLPGSRPYREYNGVSMKPGAGKSCIQCGLCAEKCPVGAIPVTDPSKTDSSRCISCMRCIALCPKDARHVSRMLLVIGSVKMKKVCGGRKKNELYM